jgi:glycosyltransferase involved in cell wall biosynthesis
VPRILEKIPQARILLMLSGEDTYRKRYDYLKNMIDKLDLAEGITLVDPAPRNELGDYLKAADCIIIPSLAEGFGYAVLEACAMQKPVVASNTTSIPEVIHGRYVLVEPKNPEAIANGVERVSRGEYDTSGPKAFTWSKTIADCIEVYTDLQKGKGLRSP